MQDSRLRPADDPTCGPDLWSWDPARRYLKSLFQASPAPAGSPSPQLRDEAPTQIAASAELPMPVHGGPHESQDPTGPPVPSPVTPPESGQVRQTATRFG